jgi:hydrogenase expression/formation protein HypE
MAEASKVGFRIDFARVPIFSEALKLQKHFDLSDEQLLSMSSTGTLIASISAEKNFEVRKTIEKDHEVRASLLGTFTQNKNRVLIREGKETSFPREAHDPYQRILSAKL